MEDNYNYKIKEWEAINSEFKRLENDYHYLDNAGATLYSERQIENVYKNFSENLFCNPHTSKATEDLIDQVRYRILKWFNTDPTHYSVVCTSGATASLKVLAECFQFANDETNHEGQFIYLNDNHTSVLGMREIIKTQNIHFIEKKDLNIKTENKLTHLLKTNTNNSLIVLPGQCNFNGAKLQLNIIQDIKELYKYAYICLDAASLVGTNYLDLNLYKYDFVTISFYKLFGYPTGLGALIVKKSVENLLKKYYYGGGTVKIAMSQLNYHQKRDSFYEKFEDGTIPFLSIISLLSGFDTLERLIPPTNSLNTMERISNYTFNLAKYLYNELKSMQYPNNQPVIKLYHDNDFNDIKLQGCIVNFNILRDNSEYVGYAEFSYMANINNVYIRTGCFCNPGACQRCLNLTNNELKTHFKAGHICGDSVDLINGVPTGSIRISIGYMTTIKNIHKLIELINDCYIKKSIKEISKITLKNIYEKKSSKIKSKHLLKICIYPIKSCGQMKITSKWLLCNKGFKYDREWMIVNANGVALTQKVNTKMCMIKPYVDYKKGFMYLNYPGMTAIEIPIVMQNHSKLTAVTLCQSKVCGDHIQGIDCGDAVAKWLSIALNIDGLRLIKHSDNDVRLFKAIDKTKQKEITLSNQAQFLLINKTSVNWLANKVDEWTNDGVLSNEQLDNAIDRFRGNLIIETENYLEELEWKHIQIGDIKFMAERPCTRCQMICINQETGERTSEPLQTIAREFQGKMKFGVYLSLLTNIDKDCFIYCNDEITTS